MYWTYPSRDDRLLDWKDDEDPGRKSFVSEVWGRQAEEGASKSFVGSFRRQLLKVVSFVVAGIALIFFFADSFAPCLTDATQQEAILVPRALSEYTRAVLTPLLEVFQVYPPVLTVTPSGVLEITDGSTNATVEIIDANRPTCQEVVAVYSFANSYGAPFVGNYSPPACSFNRVTWNLTVTSAGRQFDRLGIVYLGDIEVFRTSTAEPTASGIEWTYLKVGYNTTRAGLC